MFPSIPTQVTPQRRSRSAFTLLELVVVLSVLGVLAAAVASFSPSPYLAQRLGAKQETQYLLSALRAARSTAIATAQPVEMDWIQGKENILLSTHVSGYSSDRQPPAHFFPSYLKMDWSSSRLTFQPDGSSDRSLTMVVAGPVGPHYVLDVLSASGQVNLIVKE